MAGRFWEGSLQPCHACLALTQCAFGRSVGEQVQRVRCFHQTFCIFFHFQITGDKRDDRSHLDHAGILSSAQQYGTGSGVGGDVGAVAYRRGKEAFLSAQPVDLGYGTGIQIQKVSEFPLWRQFRAGFQLSAFDIAFQQFCQCCIFRTGQAAQIGFPAHGIIVK